MNRRTFLYTLSVGGSLMIASKSASAMPIEQDATVIFAGVEVPCRISQASGQVRGLVLLLPGSLYSDVDGNYPSMNMRPHAYADLARQLSDRGFTVLRMAKIGPGTGSRTLDAEAAKQHTDFRTRVSVAEAGLKLLLSTVPGKSVFVAGHSEGAVVASLLAGSPAGTLIDGVISLSGPALPLLSILRGQVASMAPPGTVPDMSVFDRTVAAIRNGEELPAEARSNPQTMMLASMPEQGLAYLRSIDRIDPTAAISHVPQRMLLIQGERDESVPHQQVEMLREARGRMPTAVAKFPNLTHFYKVGSEGMSPMQVMGLESESDPAVADTIKDWIEERRR
ncbi:alpha/beta fold hydrolase [Erythrobacter sp.]|uniref:alpha/beta hydrolase n=1 Tax=Erythrobacter sp. TaxID=1042 RepID=UPI00311D372E